MNRHMLLLLGLASASTLAMGVIDDSTARADAVLSRGETQLFPTRIDISVEVRAQIESTTVLIELPPITTAGTYTLTMPTPDGAGPVGVDIDRGNGFVALPVVAGSPPSTSGGGTNSAEFSAWAGTAPLGASLEDLEPGPLTARVRFVRILRRVGGKVAFHVGSRRCPLRPTSDAGAPTSVSVNVATGRDLVQFAASSTTLDTTNTTMDASARGARVTTPAVAGDAVVELSYAEVSSGVNVQLVTHRTPTADPLGGDAGYFLLLVDADDAPSNTPRSISMVIDHSGSMAGEKIVQAREAARAMLDYLRPIDWFTIHIFDDEIDSFRSAPVPASEENIQAARTFIKGIEDSGSTNLNGGLQAALKPPPSADRFDAVVMLSDGIATAGETDDRLIISNAWQHAGDTRIFTFSVGSDADFPLMQALAQGSRGKHVDLNNVQATRDLVLRARELFEDIRDVRLTDLSIQVDNVALTDTLPEKMPDLFTGGQVVLVGRYSTPGAGELTITGFEGAVPFTKTFVVDAPDLAEGSDIIKYVWATEKVRSLMGSIANGADESAVRDQVTQIGLAYRIQTPYTHYAGGEYYASGDSASCSASGPAAGGWIGIALAFVLRRRRRK